MPKKVSFLFLVAFCVLLVASAQSQQGPRDCVPSTQVGQSSYECIELAYEPAASVATQLNALGISKVQIKALNDKWLILYWNQSDNGDVQPALAMLRALAASLDRAEKGEGHVIQLYNLRSADQIETAAGDSTKAKHIGSDLLLVSPDADDKRTAELKRYVALLDLPRPQISLSAWSMQVSADSDSAVDQAGQTMLQEVQYFNELSQDALDRGWQRLLHLSEDPGFFDPSFYNYVGRQFLYCTNGPRCPLPGSDWSGEAGSTACGPNRYCLGFTEAFTGQRSLAKLLLGIAAAKNPLSAAQAVTKCMESESACGPAAAGVPLDEQQPVEDCADQDKKVDPSPGQHSRSLGFNCFFKQLFKSYSPANVFGMRSAIADFLFNYKYANQYPHAFVPYDLQHSASALDAQFEPLLTAFNQDLAALLKNVQDKVKNKIQSEHASVQFSSNGIVTVRVTSGSQGVVDTKTANAFRVPAAPTIADFLSAAKSAGGNAPDIISANLTARAAAAVIGGLQASREGLIKLGRTLTLKATPAASAEGSAVDLTIELDSADDGDSSTSNTILTGDTRTSADDANRVAKHNVTTQIRIDSLKLFEVSSFSAQLTRRKTSLPLLPPFLEVPYVGNFLRLPLGTSSAFHRSFVVVSAVVVPTASELAYSIAFRLDRFLNSQNRPEPFRQEPRDPANPNRPLDVRPYHQWLKQCWALQARHNSEVKSFRNLSPSCEQLTLDRIPLSLQ